MLKEELIEALAIFDSYNIPEDRQRSIITNGVRFDFTWGDPDPRRRNRFYDVFEFANFLKICTNMELELDANDLLKNYCNDGYEELLKAVEAFKSFSKKLK